MYISNSNIGMATLLQQKQNCMKTLSNGGTVIVATTNQASGGITSSEASTITSSPLTNGGGLVLSQTQAILLTNGTTGSGNIISYQQYQPQSTTATTGTTRLLMPHDMVSLPIGSIVSTAGGSLAVIATSNPAQAATANYNSIASSSTTTAAAAASSAATATQSAFFVATTAAAASGTGGVKGVIANVPTTTMSSFQQQFQQQIAASNQQQFQQSQQQRQSIAKNSFFNQTAINTNRIAAVLGSHQQQQQQQQQLQQTNATKQTTGTSPATTTRYFSQFSQQHTINSVNSNAAATSTMAVCTSNNRPTHVLINRTNSGANQVQRLQNATILKNATTKPPTASLVAATTTSAATSTSSFINHIAQNQNNSHLNHQNQRLPHKQQLQQQQQQQQQHKINNFNANSLPATHQNTPSISQHSIISSSSSLQQQQKSFKEAEPQQQVASSNSMPAAATTQSVPNGTSTIDKSTANASEEVVQSAAAVDNNAEQEAEPEVDIVINNVVCSFSVRCHLNLREIALNGFNVEFRRENGMVTMKLRRPYTTASIWSSGRITCTGATSEDQAKIAARRYARCLQKLGFRVRFHNFRVVNVLGTCSMPWAIKIVNFSEKYKKEASYEPELHPGVTYKLRYPKATLKIFSTGSITVTAASVANVQAAIEHIFPLVYEFRKKRTPEEAELLRLKQLQHQTATPDALDIEEPIADNIIKHSETQLKPSKSAIATSAKSFGTIGKNLKTTSGFSGANKRRRLQMDKDNIGGLFDVDADAVDADEPELDDCIDDEDDNIILCDTDDLIEGPEEDDDEDDL